MLQYAIGAGGVLSPLSTASLSVGSNPYWGTVEAGGLYAYVADYVGNSILQFVIGTNGALTSNTPVSQPAGNTPVSVVTSGTWQ